MFFGGCAIVAAAGAGLAQTAHIVPEAKGYHTNVIRVHPWQPHNHTHTTAPKWQLSHIQKLHLFG